MKLLTKAIEASLPALGSLDGQGKDAVAQAKFFTPTSSFSWFATEGSHEGDDFIFFGLVVSHLCPEGELGYFSLKELEAVRGAFGLGVERDLYFEPKPLNKCHRSE
jgi:hypothetical protein